MRVQDLMSSPTITCHINETLDIAAQKMWDEDIGALPIVDDGGQLIGMITDRDVCMGAYTQGRSLDVVPVRSAMARDVIWAHPEQSVGELEQVMSKHQVRRIPVIDGAGRPIGIVSLSDLARESVQPKTQMKHGPSKIAHTVAAICRPRISKQKAA